ncbi:MAG: glycosyltransferase involved in cell wall biosynthesis [Candidatus Azotimanducaceae bacterium]|jgi:glycosyltransferase involved in cell wall biosynthesis
MTSNIRVGVWLGNPNAEKWKGEGIARTVESVLTGFNAAHLDQRADVDFVFFMNKELFLDSHIELSKAYSATKISFVDILNLKPLGEELNDGIDSGSMHQANSTKFSGPHELPSSILGLALYYAMHDYKKTVGGKRNFSAFFSFFNKLGFQLFKRTYSRVVFALKLIRLSLVAIKVSKNDVVDVWWVPSPVAWGVEFLEQPVVSNFWDFFGAEFGYYWDEEILDVIYHRLKITLSKSEKILTQSNHNLNFSMLPFDIDRSKVQISYLPIPGNYQQYFGNFVNKNQGQLERTSESQAYASLKIQKYIDEVRKVKPIERFSKTGMQLEACGEIDFVKTSYLFVSTQDRPYKNLALLIRVLDRLVNKFGLDLYLITTANISFRTKAGEISEVISRNRLWNRVISLPRVPDEIHAMLYHCATLSLHASAAEGGVGAFSFMEGMSVGCPGLVGCGRHTREGKKLMGEEYEEITFPINSLKEATQVIREKLPAALSGELVKQQAAVYSFHEKRTWKDSANDYYDAFLSAKNNIAE